ncbi:MAG: NfeD family protein [Lacipirellulaceae bacterium]
MTLLDPLGWAVVFMLVGCGLIVLEVFIPSGGVISFFALVAFSASLVMAFRKDVTTGLSFIAIALVAVPTVVGLAFKAWPHTPMGKAFLGELPDEQETKPHDPRRELVGKVGVAKTKMIPSGDVLVDNRLLDAVSQGRAIEPGEAVVVVEVSSNRVVVRRAEQHEAAGLATSEKDLLNKPIEEFGLEGIDELNES